jgi:hypothetical protein
VRCPPPFSSLLNLFFSVPRPPQSPPHLWPLLYRSRRRDENQQLRSSLVSAPSGLPSAPLHGTDGDGEAEDGGDYDDDFADFDGPDVASVGLGSPHGSATKPPRPAAAAAAARPAAGAAAAAASGGNGDGEDPCPRGLVEGEVKRIATKLKELERLEKTLHSASAAALPGPGPAGAAAAAARGAGTEAMGRKSQSLAALRAEAAALVAPAPRGAPVLHDLAEPSSMAGAGAGVYGSSPERMRRLEEEVQRRKIETLRTVAKFDALQPLLHARPHDGGPRVGAGAGGRGGGRSSLSPTRGKRGRKAGNGAANGGGNGAVVVVSDRIRALEARLARMEEQVMPLGLPWPHRCHPRALLSAPIHSSPTPFLLLPRFSCPLP